jgi:hypothetical protein
MHRPNPRVMARLAPSLAVLTLTACSGGPEQAILTQFFTASRLADNTTLNNFTMVSFEPRTQGTVTSFTIASVSPEQRKPLGLKALAKAHQDAKADDVEFTRRKEEYQNANIDMIQRVLKTVRDASKLKGADAEVQATWSKYVQDGAAVSRKVAEAKRKLATESAVVELSINGGSNTPLDVSRYDGEVVSKDVMIDAAVKSPTGDRLQKTLLVTMQRAVLNADKNVTGRWIITGIKDASQSPGSPSTPRS